MKTCVQRHRLAAAIAAALLALPAEGRDTRALKAPSRLALRQSGQMVVDFSQGTYPVTGSTATGAYATLDGARGATKLGFTGATANQWANAIVTGTWDFSASDRFTLDLGSDKADFRSRITLIITSDVSGLTNYANVTWQPANHQSRFNLTTAKSAMGMEGSINWAAVRRVEIRYQRYAYATGAGTLYLYGLWSHVKARPRVLLTFDDGLAGVQSIIAPKLAAAGIKATSYVLPAKVGTAGYMSLSDLQGLYAAGWDIANHTNTHTYLAAIPATYSRSGTTATLALASNRAHGKLAGDTITVAGADEPEFNGSFTVLSVPNAYTVTFTVPETSGDTTGNGFVYLAGFTAAATIRSEVSTAQAWLDANGFSRSARHFAYPYGQWDPDVTAILKDQGVLTARATSSYNSANYQLHTITGLFEPYVLPSFSVDLDTAANALAKVDNAILQNSTIIFVGHDIAASPSGSQMATAEFDAFVAGLVTRRDAGQIDILTVSEWCRLVTKACR